MKLHRILRDALRYLDICETNPNITVDMGCWFEWLGDDREFCVVGLAGAYFCRGVVNPALSLFFMSSKHDRTLDAINALREGVVVDALDLLGIAHTRHVSIFDVCDYADDPVRFKRDMNYVLEYLVSQDY